MYNNYFWGSNFSRIRTRALKQMRVYRILHSSISYCVETL